MLFCPANTAIIPKAHVKEVFGDGDFETLEVVPGEYAFVTEMMPEKTFDEKLKNITDVLTVIRGNF